MPIISISVDDETLKKLDEVEKLQGFKGRSELVRTCVEEFIQNHESHKKLKGKVEAVITVVTKEKYESAGTEVVHDFTHITQTHIHHHLQSHQCMDVFVVRGNADLVQKMIKTLQTSSKIQKVHVAISA